MPILNVEIVGELYNPGLARTLADAAGPILDSKPAGTWVKLHMMPEMDYAENGVPTNNRPVFVSLLAAKEMSAGRRAEVARQISASFAEIMHRPAENIHILFEPEATGRMAFGGKLVK